MRVVARRPLFYRRGADPALDRPAHVRAGSALAACHGRLAVIQDDACFLALVNPETGEADDVPFPSMERRQFDDTRGNKAEKLDLEAVLFTNGRLVALGSGSSPRRERVVLVEDLATVRVIEAPELYAMLRANVAFSGCELNIEGAVVVDEDVLLFQRGNGAPAEEAVDATARIALAPLLAYLDGRGSCPPLRDVIAWDLGELTFTDGALDPSGAITFLACAEASPDATRDGPVSAVAIGRLQEARRIFEVTPILDEHGAPLVEKAEGLAFVGSRVFVVTDRDDPGAPSELLELV